MSEESAFVGRQAIVDRDRRVVAYELLYRRGAASTVADYDEQSVAAVRVIANTFASLGEEAVLGGATGYFNVTREVLLSEAVYALPKERVVIELLEQIAYDREVELRCRELREAGYSIALDDWVIDDPRRELLPFVDIVKVELPAIAPRDWRRVARSLHDARKLVLAEKVETEEQYRACHKAGFDRFQGYFFARPVVLEGRNFDPAQTSLVRLLRQIIGEADLTTIVDSFKQDARLGVNLLRLVNTAGRATRLRLESIEDGVRHLGLDQLARWISVLLYAQGRSGGVRDPLLTLAVHRGRLLELLADAAAQRGTLHAERERAFLVGMLSLIDVLLGRPLVTIVRELGLGPELEQALVAGEGELGRLLALARACERGDVDEIEQHCAELRISLAELQGHDHAAYAWVHALQQSLVV